MESKEFAEVISEFFIGKYAILTMSANIPHSGFNFLLIDGLYYVPEIVYDLGANVIAIESKDSFVGKNVEFVKCSK